MPRKANYDKAVALERAVELFWSRGYYASSMKDIEQALDMRPGSIYATFGSKSGLFEQALDTYAQKTGYEFEQIMSSANSALNGLKMYLTSLANTCPKKTGFASHTCMLIKTLLEINQEDKALRDKVQSMLSNIEQRLYLALLEAKAQGDLRDNVDCERLARLLQVQIIGLRAFSERKIPAVQASNIADDLVNILNSYSSAN